MESKMNPPLNSTAAADRKIYFFLGAWLIINLLQAYFTGLHPDEAYYWLYSRFLAWGYFDHPPMVALFIRGGDWLLHNPLGLRLMTVLSGTLAAFFLWKIVKQYAVNAGLFILLFCSFVLFNVYGFITTPDAPMALFSVLFFYLYQQYLKRESGVVILALAVTVALLLYSKYHGVLILFFTLLSGPAVLKRPSLWIIAGIALLLYAPHIYWQLQNGLPSVQYHLFDRSARLYRLSFTVEYIWSQLLIAGPLVGWYFYTIGFKTKAADPFLKAIRVSFSGIFIFFLLMTFKGRIEAHWTLIAFIPLFILSYVYLSAKATLPLWLKRLLIANLYLIIFARLVPVIPMPGIRQLKAVKEFYGTLEWAAAIRAKAGAAPVIFDAGFQAPSRYNYYNRTVNGFAYDSRTYRKTQYDSWPIEDSLRNKKIYYVLDRPHRDGLPQDSFQTTKGVWYGEWIDKVRIYQKLKIKVAAGNRYWQPGEQRQVVLTLENPYSEPVALSNTNQQWRCFMEYGYNEKGNWSAFTGIDPAQTETVYLPAGGKASLQAIISAPVKSGKYKLLFSIRTEPFPGAASSSLTDVIVK